MDLFARARVAAGVLVGAAILSASSTAWAHVAHVASGFSSGFLHPLMGLDHVLAMVAVGIWGSRLGRPSFWSLPTFFGLVMILGALLSGTGVRLPAVEPALAASVIVLGILVAFAPAHWFAVVVVAALAVFHGYAHGLALPASENPFVHGLGFAAATALLQIAGVAIGLKARRPMGRQLVRGVVVAIAVVGLLLLAPEFAG